MPWKSNDEDVAGTGLLTVLRTASLPASALAMLQPYNPERQLDTPDTNICSRLLEK